MRRYGASIVSSLNRVRSLLQRIAARRLCPFEVLAAMQRSTGAEKVKRERDDRNTAMVEALVRSGKPILLELGAGDSLKGSG